MADIVTEDFTQNLYASPSGQRKKPTIFDELRLAMQHAERPLEQTIQMISEFHGAWTGVSKELSNLIQMVSSDNTSLQSVQQALNLLDTVNNVSHSLVGRQNMITCALMNTPLLREFVEKVQSLNPMINTYIQNNIGKFPYFQQISEDVCSFGQIVLSKSEIPPVDRILSGGKNSLESSYPLRRNVGFKMFETIETVIDESNNLVDTLFLRAMKVENNMSLLKTDYGKNGSAIAHGHNFTQDVFNAKRSINAIKPCISQATSKFGPTLQLCNSFFPVKYQVSNNARFYNLTAEGLPYIADKLNLPITREVKEPIAQENNKSSIS